MLHVAYTTPMLVHRKKSTLAKTNGVSPQCAKRSSGKITSFWPENPPKFVVSQNTEVRHVAIVRQLVSFPKEDICLWTFVLAKFVCVPMCVFAKPHALRDRLCSVVLQLTPRPCPPTPTGCPPISTGRSSSPPQLNVPAPEIPAGDGNLAGAVHQEAPVVEEDYGTMAVVTEGTLMVSPLFCI